MNFSHFFRISINVIINTTKINKHSMLFVLQEASGGQTDCVVCPSRTLWRTNNTVLPVA